MTKKKINSRAKGKNGELELAHILTDKGFPARRGQQYSGNPDSPDIICESLSEFHIECKRTELVSLWKWLAQANKDKGEHQTPLIIHRKNGEDWLAILPLTGFLDLVERVKHVQS